jgi:hypothetical protein
MMFFARSQMSAAGWGGASKGRVTSVCLRYARNPDVARGSGPVAAVHAGPVLAIFRGEIPEAPRARAIFPSGESPASSRKLKIVEKLTLFLPQTY